MLSHNIIHPSFQYGASLKIGNFCIIEEDVVVGKEVKLGNYVMLKKGTHFGDGVELADNCVTTGACWVGNNVVARTGAILSKANIVEDDVFLGPGVVTNHTKHVTHRRPSLQGTQLLTYIGAGSIIGSQVSLLAGLYISPHVIIGGGSVVVKSLLNEGVYVGNPLRRIGSLPPGYATKLPPNAGKMYLQLEQLEFLQKYLPLLNAQKLLDEVNYASC